MFEYRQEKMEKLMKENEEFLRVFNRHQELDKRVTDAEVGTAPMDDLVFNRHQELDKRVTDAEVGTAPMDDLALNKLKKEKLWAKDQLARIMDTANA